MPDVTNAIVVGTANVPKGLDNEKIETPARYDDVRIKIISGVTVVAVRAFRTFLQVFVAVLLGGISGPLIPGISDALPPSQATEKLMAALYIAAISALIAAAQKAAELMARLDTKAPEWMA
jgi:hypothetical protein